MLQRAMIAAAVVARPKLLLLDEPTSGLDPLMQNKFIELILEEKQRGTTILLSSHIFEEVERTCDRVAFIVNGRIMALDSPHNLIMSKGAARVSYSWMEEQEQTADCPLHLISQDERLRQVILENRLLSIHSSEPTLNDIFMDVTGRTLV